MGETAVMSTVEDAEVAETEIVIVVDPDAVGEAERLLVETRQLFGGVVVVGRPAFLDAARGSDVDVRCALSSATLHGDGGGM